MNKQRPVFLQLNVAEMPITALVSILHRMSGIVLFLGLPVLLYLLQQSLASPESYAALQDCLSGTFARLGLWVLLSAVAYHVIAGVRHLIMDLGHAETKAGGQQAAVTVLILGAIAVLLLGVWVW